MKIRLLVIVMFLIGNVNAQVNPHAIGIRGGLGNYGYGGEISYQHGFGDANRLELDLGWRNNTHKGNNYNHTILSGVYHWVWNIEDGFNWYAGLGGQVGFFNDRWLNESGVSLAAGGQLGIEYDFNDLGAPILLSIDVRPMWGFTYYGNGFGYGGSFGIRYTF